MINYKEHKLPENRCEKCGWSIEHNRCNSAELTCEYGNVNEYVSRYGYCDVFEKDPHK